MKSTIVFEVPVPLGREHDPYSFDCGTPELDLWLKNRALKNEGRFSRTFVALSDGAIAGFYCLSAGSVRREAMPGRLRRNGPEAIPVAIIGRLAVNRAHARQGLGKSLLQDAFTRIGNVADQLGIAAILVQALDEKARGFYLAAAEFIEFPQSSRILYLPIAQLKEAPVSCSSLPG